MLSGQVADAIATVIVGQLVRVMHSSMLFMDRYSLPGGICVVKNSIFLSKLHLCTLTLLGFLGFQWFSSETIQLKPTLMSLTQCWI